MSLRGGRWALLAGILLQILFLVSLRTQFLNPLFIEARHAYGQAGDSFGIWQAGDNLVHGKSIYDSPDYRNEAVRHVPYGYFYRYLPPTAYVSALASRVLPPWTAYVLWVVLNEILLFWIVARLLRLGAFDARDRRLYAGLWLGFFPFYLEQWMGQFSFLMGAFLWLLLLEGMAGRGEPPPRGRAFWAWTASVGLKSYPALFAFPYLRRRWFRPVAACAAVVALASAPYFLLRRGDLREFLFLNFHPLPAGIHGGTLGASALVRELCWMLPDSIVGRRIGFGFLSCYLGNAPVFGMIALVAASSLWVTWRYGRSAPLNLQIALWTLAFFLTFKDIWEYHYVMLLPVVTAIGLMSRSRLVLWMGLLLALPTPYALFGKPDLDPGTGAAVLQHASKAIPTFVLFGWTLAAVARGPREG